MIPASLFNAIKNHELIDRLVFYDPTTEKIYSWNCKINIRFYTAIIAHILTETHDEVYTLFTPDTFNYLLVIVNKPDKVLTTVIVHLIQTTNINQWNYKMDIKN